MILDNAASTLILQAVSAPGTAIPFGVSFYEQSQAFTIKADTSPATWPNPQKNLDQLAAAGTTAVTALAAPAVGFRRIVQHIWLRNAAGGSVTYKVILEDTAETPTQVELRFTLATADMLFYDGGPDGGSWSVLNSAGALTTSGSTGATGVQGVAGVPVYLLAEDGEEGSAGAPGSPGAGITGAAGPAGPAVFLSAEDGEDGFPLPGLRGDIGITGATGAAGPVAPAVVFIVGDEGGGDDAMGGGGTSTPHALLDGNVDNDTATGTVVAGDIIVGNATPKWSRLATANGAMLRTNNTGVVGWSQSMTDGQLMIGATGGTAAPQVLTAGTNITVTNGSGAITISATGGTTAATQAQMEAATDNTVMATPLAMKWNPGVAKAWISFNGTGTPAVIESYNMSTTITDNGVGDFTVTFTTAFSTAGYVVVEGVGNFTASQANRSMTTNSTTVPAVGSCRVNCQANAGPEDNVRNMLAFFGDQ